MEDDVEVELELEKQLSLAHELFWSKSVVYYLPSWKNKKKVPVVLKHKTKKQYPNMLVKESLQKSAVINKYL